MGSMKIPVWVYTAKNGYAWQGLEDNPEDRPTAAALDKALAAAGKTAGAWGAVVRRPVASRRWAEWPRSRLCWLLFRFHPEAGRDQRGRSCNYTAVTCIPAGNGLPKLDFGKLFADPALAEVKSEGLGDIWIDLDGDEDFALKAPLLKPRGADAPPDPSWVDSWGTPILLKDDALRTLSRWCQDPRVDAGDLKAIVREGMAGADEPVVHATWTVYPQVAAAKAAEREWFAAQGEGGATARQALEKWRAALGAVGELNRALGGLEGLAALAGKWNASLEKAADATREAELSARQRAAAAASAEAAAEEIKRGLQRYRMATDAERGKGANRWKLDDLGRQIEDARRRHGPGARWNAAEQELDELRRRTTLLEGHMDTLRAYQRSAAEGKGSPLEQEAREALARARELARWGNGTFAQEAIFEMERLYRIGHAQSAPAPAPAPAGGGNAEYVRHGRGHRRRSGRHWWKKWRAAVAATGAMLLLAVSWCMMRQGELEKWNEIRKKACMHAKDCNYSQAIAMLDGIPCGKWKQVILRLSKNDYAKDLRTRWNVLRLLAPPLKNAMADENNAWAALDGLEKEKIGIFEKKKAKAQDEWDAYEKARQEAVDLRKRLRMNEEGIPVSLVVPPGGSMEQAWSNLPELYAEVANQWRMAAMHLNSACQKIDRIENPTLQERRLALLATDPGHLATARERAEDARSRLTTHEWETAALDIGRKYAWNQWGEYTQYRKMANDFITTIEYDTDGWPYRRSAVGRQPLALDAGALRKLADDYRTAAENWTKARSARTLACQSIQPALDEGRRKLITACKQERAEMKNLEDLRKDVRYEAAEHSPLTVEVWNEFVDLYNRACQLKEHIPQINGGLPVPAPTVLETNTLGNLCAELNEVSELWQLAQQKLAETYKIIDQEKAGPTGPTQGHKAILPEMDEKTQAQQESALDPEPKPEPEPEPHSKPDMELQPKDAGPDDGENATIPATSTGTKAEKTMDNSSSGGKKEKETWAVKRWWRKNIVSLFRSDDDKDAL